MRVRFTSLKALFEIGADISLTRRFEVAPCYSEGLKTTEKAREEQAPSTEDDLEHILNKTLNCTPTIALHGQTISQPQALHHSGYF